MRWIECECRRFNALCDLSEYFWSTIGADGVGCVLAFHCIFLEALVSTDCLFSLNACIPEVVAMGCERYSIGESVSSVLACASIRDAKNLFWNKVESFFFWWLPEEIVCTNLLDVHYLRRHNVWRNKGSQIPLEELLSILCHTKKEKTESVGCPPFYSFRNMEVWVYFLQRIPRRP